MGLLARAIVVCYSDTAKGSGHGQGKCVRFGATKATRRAWGTCQQGELALLPLRGEFDSGFC